MSRSTRQSSSVTKLMATPLRPNRPPRPILIRKINNQSNIQLINKANLIFSLPVDVVFTMVGQIVVDHEGNLLDVNTTSQEIGRNQNAGRTRSELAHNDVTFLLLHLTVHGGYGEIPFVHFLCEPIDFPASVTENDGLSNTQCVVQVAQRVQLPLLSFNLINQTCGT